MLDADGFGWLMVLLFMPGAALLVVPVDIVPDPRAGGTLLPEALPVVGLLDADGFGAPMVVLLFMPGA